MVLSEVFLHINLFLLTNYCHDWVKVWFELLIRFSSGVVGDQKLGNVNRNSKAPFMNDVTEKSDFWEKSKFLDFPDSAL